MQSLEETKRELASIKSKLNHFEEGHSFLLCHVNETQDERYLPLVAKNEETFKSLKERVARLERQTDQHPTVYDWEEDHKWRKEEHEKRMEKLRSYSKELNEKTRERDQVLRDLCDYVKMTPWYGECPALKQVVEEIESKRWA